MPRVTANLVEWKDDKGYGFARQAGGTERIFVHVKAFDSHGPRPKKGDELEFDMVAGRNGKPAAENVKVLGAEEIARQLPFHLVTAVMLFLLAQIVVILGRAPVEILVVYAVMGGLSMYLYSRDKQAAVFGWWRIRETTLITVDLLGGIIGGLLAQHRYRHKQSKASYQLRTLFVVAFHAALLAALGSGFLSLDNIEGMVRAVSGS